MKALLAALAILVATPAFAQDVSLVGTWIGQRDRIAKVEGRRGGLATLVITEQQGNTFAGRLKRSNTTGDEEEPLWGAFTPGGKLMMGTDDEGGPICSASSTRTRSIIATPRPGVRRERCARGSPVSADVHRRGCDHLKRGSQEWRGRQVSKPRAAASFLPRLDRL
jgi:hypothetical protein